MGQNSNMNSYIIHKRGLLYEYTLLLLGELDGFSTAYFGKRSVDNDGFARYICKIAFEKFLRWTPEKVASDLTEGIVKRLKLDRIFPYLQIPPEIERTKQYGLLASVIYPDKIKIDRRHLVIETYEAILKGAENGGLYRFPKHYFDGLTGRERACICFRYMFEHNCSFDSVKKMYEFFSSEKGVRLINEKGLKLVLKDVFRSPVLFLHESLPPNKKNDFWYHYYEFQFWYRKERQIHDRIIRERDRARKKALEAEKAAKEAQETPES